MIPVHGQQIIGQREKQEDSFAIIRQNDQDPSSDVLMLLADGMGGHIGGEVAAGLAIQAFSEFFTGQAKAKRPRERLQEALLAANEAVRVSLARDASLRGMGCTLIGAIKIADNLHWVSVGDSAIYLFRRGELTRLNADHSLLGELMENVERGKLTRAEALAHPRRNALRSALVGGPIALLDSRSVVLELDDIVVVASDGLDTLSPMEMTETLLRAPRSPRDLANLLLQAIERRQLPSQDNTTVIVYWHLDGAPSAFYRDSKWSFRAKSRHFGLLTALLLSVFVIISTGLAFWLVQPDPNWSWPADSKESGRDTVRDRRNGISSEKDPASGNAIKDTTQLGKEEPNQAPLPQKKEQDSSEPVGGT